ncbi:hypothetical protein HMPREF3034_00077 [Prevotella sp. DNF00663]|nr:hypothetical protein HMPREF0671_07555 [Prevotella sp. S7 MS 2]KXB86025.1 hypothetical protein HMPREF3034_00077 [Prevotella sp. DNF00663]
MVDTNIRKNHIHSAAKPLQHHCKGEAGMLKRARSIAATALQDDNRRINELTSKQDGLAKGTRMS